MCDLGDAGFDDLINLVCAKVGSSPTVSSPCC